MAKFHIGRNGKAAQCNAKKGNCPYGTDEEHFSSRAAAQKASEEKMTRENKVMSSNSAKKEKTLPNKKEYGRDEFLLNKSYNSLAQNFANKNNQLYKKIDLYNKQYDDINKKINSLKQNGTLTIKQEEYLRAQQEEMEQRAYDAQYESFYNNISMYKYKILEEASSNSPDMKKIKEHLKRYEDNRGYVSAPYTIEEESNDGIKDNNEKILLLKQEIESKENAENNDEVQQLKNSLAIETAKKSINELMLEVIKKHPDEEKIRNKIFDIAKFKKYHDAYSK